MSAEVKATRLFLNVEGGATWARVYEGHLAPGNNKIKVPQLGKDTDSLDLMEESGKQGALTLISSQVRPHGGAVLTVRNDKDAPNSRFTVTAGLNAGVSIQHRLSLTADGNAELASYAKITNNSETALKDVNVTLTAGENQSSGGRGGAVPFAARSAAFSPSTEPVAVSPNVYRFDLAQKVSLKKDESVTVNLFNRDFVPVMVKRSFEYAGNGGQVYDADKREYDGGSVETKISLENAKSNGIGVTLPAGNFRITTPEGTLLADARIGDTPAGSTIALDAGRMFDMEVKRQQTSFTSGPTREDPQDKRYQLRSDTIGQKVTFTNRSKQDQAVMFTDRIPRSDGTEPTLIGGVTVNGKAIDKTAFSIDAKTGRLVIPSIEVRAGQQATVEYAAVRARRLS